MPRKILIVAAFASAGLLAACSTARDPATELPAGAAAPVAAVIGAPAPAPTPATARPPAPRPATRPAPRPTTTPPSSVADFSDLPPLLKGRSTWVQPGRTLAVRTGSGGTAVPLFRQAIVLANVRAAVAAARVEPRTDFQRGQLSLVFNKGTSPQIADAINRALAVPEVNHLTVQLPR